MENKDTQLNGKRILIFQQRNWAKSIGHFLAEQLHAQARAEPRQQLRGQADLGH